MQTSMEPTFTGGRDRRAANAQPSARVGSVVPPKKFKPSSPTPLASPGGTLDYGPNILSSSVPMSLRTAMRILSSSGDKRLMTLLHEQKTLQNLCLTNNI